MGAIINSRQGAEPEVIVVAEEWRGYAIAALLARSGRRVSVVTLGKSPALPAHLYPSFSFAHGPWLYFGFEKGGLADTLFSELAFSVPILRQEGYYHRMAPPLQVVLPSQRIDLSSDREELLDDLKREFGPSYGGIRALLTELDKNDLDIYPAIGRVSSLEPRGLRDRIAIFREKWNQRKSIRGSGAQKALAFIRHHLADPHWESFLGLQSLFAFQKPLDQMSVLDLLILHGGLQRGAIRLVGGDARLNQLFIDLVRKYQGEVIGADTPVKILRGRRGEGEVSIEGRGTFRAPFLVVALPESIPEPSSGAGELWVAFEASQEVIPDPMRETLVLSWARGASPIHYNYLALQLSLSSEEKGSEKGMRRMVASALLTPDEMQAGRFSEIEEAMEERIRWLLPFSEKRLRRLTSSHFMPQSRSRSLLDPSLLNSLRLVDLGATSLFRASSNPAVYVVPTSTPGKIDRLSFVLAGLYLTKVRT